MSDLLLLGPGSHMPLWVVLLEQQVFGEPWGPLESHEHLFGLQPHAYARWCTIPTAGEAELLRLGVSEEARRQGLARRLLEESERFMIREGIDTLHLEVRISNRPARALYESLGWTLQRLRKGYYRDGEDAVIYRKELAKSE